MIIDDLTIIKPHAVPDANSILRELDRYVDGYGERILRIDVAQVPEELIRQHYAQHMGKPFYENLVRQFAGNPAVFNIHRGSDVKLIEKIMEACGPTDPAIARKERPSTLRARYSNDTLAQAIEQGRAVNNVIHRPDSLEAAEREIKIWESFLRNARAS